MSRRPLSLTSATRRKLLKAFAATGMLAGIERNRVLAQSAPDYKALVCLYLHGGNDGENTLVRYDNAGYQNYASIRTPASGINIPQGQLLPIQPARLATPFGFHPACGPLKSLFEQKKLAVIANMGVLARPVTKPALAGGAPRPANLFSHLDQEMQIQTADYTSFDRVGWGGRIADKLDPFNPGTLFPPLITTGGMKVFTSGRMSIPYAFQGNSNGLRLNPSGGGSSALQFDALSEAAQREILAQGYTNTYDLAAKLLSEEGFESASVLAPVLDNPSSIVRPYFANLNSYVANQLRGIALVIEGRAQTQMKRQVFYAWAPGYDTHGSQLAYQQGVLNELSQALKALDDAMTALGLAGSVTSFTLSDFGRTFEPAASAGTDHGWGNYAFVMGGAVRGGDFYGTVPTPVLNGPDDIEKNGRWIPTTSLEQYGATLARWFGIGEADLNYVFPNMASFANTNLGFMS